MSRSFLDHYARFWLIALGVYFLLVIRFLGIPVILEHIDISAPQMELLAQAASAKSTGELLGGNASSSLWGLGVIALALTAIPLLRKNSLSFPNQFSCRHWSGFSASGYLHFIPWMPTSLCRVLFTCFFAWSAF
jgi:hypothetical protein